MFKNTSSQKGVVTPSLVLFGPVLLSIGAAVSTAGLPNTGAVQPQTTQETVINGSIASNGKLRGGLPYNTIQPSKD